MPTNLNSHSTAATLPFLESSSQFCASPYINSSERVDLALSLCRSQLKLGLANRRERGAAVGRQLALSLKPTLGRALVERSPLPPPGLFALRQLFIYFSVCFR